MKRCVALCSFCVYRCWFLFGSSGLRNPKPPSPRLPLTSAMKFARLVIVPRLKSFPGTVMGKIFS